MEHNIKTNVNIQLTAKTRCTEDFGLTHTLGMNIEDVKFCLSQHYQDLYDFFSNIFFDNTIPKVYNLVVLGDNRTAILFELFFSIIFEQASEEEKQQMNDKRVYFITKDFLASNIETIINKIHDKDISKMLCIFDSTQPDSNVKELTEMIQEVILNIEPTLCNKVHIKVIYRANYRLFINPNFRFEIVSKISDSEIRGYNTRCSELLSNSPLTNIGYLPSVLVDNTFIDFDHINGFIKNDKNYFLSLQEKIPVSAGIQVIDNFLSSKKTIIPFIFLPKLTKGNCEDLVNEISKRWNRWTEEIFPKESILELEGVLFVLGLSLLKIFLDNDDTIKSINIFKVCANFGVYDEDFFESLLNKNILFNKNELTYLFFKVFKDNSKMQEFYNVVGNQNTIEEFEEYFFKKVMMEYKYEHDNWNMYKSSMNTNYFDLRYVSINSFFKEFSVSNNCVSNILVCYNQNIIEECICRKADGVYNQYFRNGIEAEHCVLKNYDEVLILLINLNKKFTYEDYIEELTGNSVCGNEVKYLSCNTEADKYKDKYVDEVYKRYLEKNKKHKQVPNDRIHLFIHGNVHANIPLNILMRTRHGIGAIKTLKSRKRKF